MLNLKLLQQAHITTPRPLPQRLVFPLLTLDYRLKRPRTRVVVEGLEHLPQDRPVFIAMNHSDRFSYGPLLWHMHRRGLPRYVATWIKGKYFQSDLMARFFTWTGNIPLPSRGYLISATFQQRLGRPPTSDEYRTLRDLVDRTLTPDDVTLTAPLQQYAGTWERGLAVGVEALFADMMTEVMRLHREAMGAGQRHVLVFPEGTRSRHLLPGRTGLMEAAQHLGVPIVPIACIGGDRLYPGDAPLSRGGVVCYRVAPPLELGGDALGPHRITEPFTPFTRDAQARFGPQLQAATRVVMDQINDMLPARYRRRAEGAEGSDEDAGAKRFL